jgi:hypothetical protein
LNLGQVVAAGSVAEVLGQADRNVIQVRVAPASVAKAMKVLKEAPQVERVTATDELTGQLAVELAAPEDESAPVEPLARNNLLEALILAEVPVVSFGFAGNRLQDLFLQVTDEAIS